MSLGSYRRQWEAGVAGRRRRRDTSSRRKGGPAVDRAQVSIGNAVANTHPSRCDRRQGTAAEEAALAPRRTTSRCNAPANPSGGISCRRIGNTAAAAHGCQPVWQRSLVARSITVASLPAASNPDPRYREDLPGDRSRPDRRSGRGYLHRSQSTAVPIASAFPSPAVNPTDRTAGAAIPQSLDAPLPPALCRAGNRASSIASALPTQQRVKEEQVPEADSA